MGLISVVFVRWVLILCCISVVFSCCILSVSFVICGDSMILGSVCRLVGMLGFFLNMLSVVLVMWLLCKVVVSVGVCRIEFCFRLIR